ncbi:hypothetical protein C8R44DRAFT_738057 [Mycena epipterygia]|nr:hypothetical protein C8R44DRAFT_738057 [Mycena epipterygia]
MDSRDVNFKAPCTKSAGFCAVFNKASAHHHGLFKLSEAKDQMRNDGATPDESLPALPGSNPLLGHLGHPSPGFPGWSQGPVDARYWNVSMAGTIQPYLNPPPAFPFVRDNYYSNAPSPAAPVLNEGYQHTRPSRSSPSYPPLTQPVFHPSSAHYSLGYDQTQFFGDAAMPEYQYESSVELATGFYKNGDYPPSPPELLVLLGTTSPDYSFRML